MDGASAAERRCWPWGWLELLFSQLRTARSGPRAPRSVAGKPSGTAALRAG